MVTTNAAGKISAYAPTCTTGCDKCMIDEAGRERCLECTDPTNVIAMDYTCAAASTCEDVQGFVNSNGHCVPCTLAHAGCLECLPMSAPSPKRNLQWGAWDSSPSVVCTQCLNPTPPGGSVTGPFGPSRRNLNTPPTYTFVGSQSTTIMSNTWDFAPTAGPLKSSVMSSGAAYFFWGGCPTAVAMAAD